ncbi:ribonuclease HII [Pontibacter sp. G13]|uniref:ribonuclease HII n=1 Tax=Pontibacter sp. G13 TaxID=3074898 RepID=UPI0028899CB9|nr:ribonuclease HII [Pontibacter sp. G13]WNJ18915.1 ribonuclease HII [Pontibacter sp. G13]
MKLEQTFTGLELEAGVDEAGRGCLAGPVVAAAVILPLDYTLSGLDDSKKLTEKKRYELRKEILAHAEYWCVGMSSAQRIDQVNILNATYDAMHEALAGLGAKPNHVLIDGNRFRPWEDVPYDCMIKGDGRFLNIAAASILAKTYRDEIMEMLDQEFPQYGWKGNKGYPTKAHKEAIRDHGPSPYHRMSFNWQIPPTLF